MTYAPKDWELAKYFVDKYQDMNDPTPALAHYFAKVRLQALEDAATLAEAYSLSAAMAIREIKDP